MTGVQKFIEVAKGFRASNLKQYGFTKSEIRDGVKRMIHCKYIEML